MLAPAIQVVVKDLGALLQSTALKTALADLGAGAKLVADNIGLIVTAVELLLAKSAVQWLIGVGAGIASVAKEAAIAEAAMAGLTAGAEALLAAIGGIPGLIAIAVVGIYELATA